MARKQVPASKAGRQSSPPSARETRGFEAVQNKVKEVIQRQQGTAMRASKFERIQTGIPGLYELIEGGIEKGGTILVVGSAGTGKTTFGLQFLYKGAVEFGDPGIFITFEEGKES